MFPKTFDEHQPFSKLFSRTTAYGMQLYSTTKLYENTHRYPGIQYTRQPPHQTNVKHDNALSQEFQKLRERLPAKKRKAAAQVAKKSNGGVGDGQKWAAGGMDRAGRRVVCVAKVMVYKMI